MSAEELGFTSSIQEDVILTSQSTQNGSIIALTEEQVGNNDVGYFDPSKRIVIQRLLAAASMAVVAPQASLDPEPWERLSQAITKPSVMNAGAFNHFHRLVEGCWGLSNNGEMDVAEEVLSNFLPRMIELAPYQSEAAMLAAQGLRLRSILSAHQLKLSDMVPLCQLSVDCARQANDYDTLSAALNGLAVAFKYVQHSEDSFKSYQEAIYYSDHASPLLRSRVYAGFAAALAQRGRKQEAGLYIHLAYENFPDHPENDPNFLSADNGIFMLAYYEGLTYLALCRPEEAEKAFESYKKQLANAAIPERNRLEIINYRGQAAILANNLDLYALCLEEGLSGAMALKSKKRFDEAVNIYQKDMPKKWLLEPHIKQITECFQLPMGEQQGKKL